jgi:tetratricopeptide (TPR) repeat protein
MSPEQACGETLDHRSDLFSLGSVLYVMCTGQPPFRAPRTLGVLKRVCDDTPQPLREINEHIPEALAAVVNRLLVKDPAGRFQSAAAVADLLRQHLAHLDDPALPCLPPTLAGTESTDPVPHVSAQAKSVPSPRRDLDDRVLRKPSRVGWWKWAAAAACLLPVLALALTETFGVTHLFQAGSAPADPDLPASEPPALAAKSESPVPADPKVQEEKKEPAATPPAADEHPFKGAKVGDWAAYRLTQESQGRKMDQTITREVTARTETTAKIKTTTTVFGRDMASPEQEIDLAKPYDPTNPASLPRGAGLKVETVDNGKESIKLGHKEYQASYTKVKVTAQGNGGSLEENTTYWMSQSAPLDGLVKMERVALLKQAARTAEIKVTMELTGSGHKLYPTEARRLAARGDWAAAAAEYARIFAAQPLEDGEQGFEYATVLLLSGDQAGHRKFCAEMLERSGQRSVRPYHVARACTLAADSVKDFALPAGKAADELRQHNREFWSLTEQGALAYRAGRLDEAVTLFQKSLQADGKPGRAVLNWLWLSLAEERRGKPAEARVWLDRARQWLEGKSTSVPVVPDDATGFHLHNWLEAQVLYREAQTLLAPKQ